MSINGKVIQIAVGQVNDDKGYTYPVVYALTSDGQIWTDQVRSNEGHYIPSATYRRNWCSLSAAKPEKFIQKQIDLDRANEITDLLGEMDSETGEI
jgi:hypothetical protein